MTKTSHKKTYIVIAVILACGITLAAVCGGLAFLGWHVYVGQAREAISQNPVIVEQIGEIERFKWDLVASVWEEGGDVFVFRVWGTKAAGTVTAELVTIDGDTEELVSGVLRLSTGETFDLFPQEEPTSVPAGPADE